MKNPIHVRTFNIYESPRRGEGLRIGVTRRPPRGIRKEDWKDFFDVWFPVLAPSARLLNRYQLAEISISTFFKLYEREIMRKAESRQSLELLAKMASKTRFSIGCYCADESLCHRSHLRKMIEKAGGKS